MDAKRLNEKRKEMKMSIETLAEKSNLPKSTVEKILFGITENPRYDTIHAIEQALELDKTDTKETASVELTPQEDRMLQAFRGLNDSSRELVIMLLQSIQK